MSGGDLSDCRLMQDEPRRIPFFVSVVIVAVASGVICGGIAWFVWTIYKAVTQ